RYKWSTGAMTQQITVDRPGTYILTAISGKNCVAEGQIEVRKDCFLDIPNAFSPDGDGINDYFFPGSHFSGSVRDFRIMIFNRWGQKLYESTSLNDPGWDGSWIGAPQPAGVYIYQ